MSTRFSIRSARSLESPEKLFLLYAIAAAFVAAGLHRFSVAEGLRLSGSFATGLGMAELVAGLLLLARAQRWCALSGSVLALVASMMAVGLLFMFQTGSLAGEALKESVLFGGALWSLMRAVKSMPKVAISEAADIEEEGFAQGIYVPPMPKVVIEPELRARDLARQVVRDARQASLGKEAGGHAEAVPGLDRLHNGANRPAAARFSEVGRVDPSPLALGIFASAERVREPVVKKAEPDNRGEWPTLDIDTAMATAPLSGDDQATREFNSRTLQQMPALRF